MIVFVCESCARKLFVEEEHAGSEVQCPACGTTTTAPRQTLSAASLDDTAASSPDVGTAEATEYPSVVSETDNRPHVDTRLTYFLSPALAGDELGRLGKYRILKILGHGGMGVVYQAEDTQLERLVALKAMLPQLSGSATAGKRFLREARTMAKIKHDHVVTIYNVDEDRNVAFVAMELLTGESLSARLRREPVLPLRELLRIGRECADGLGAAHAQGLIHRDIKPGNVWLEAPKGRVKILDFGLARAAEQEEGQRLTQQGSLVGTPEYMAPEQTRDDNVDLRCDLWSLGVLLYRASTGKLPFQGTDTAGTIVALETETPLPPAQLNEALPAELSKLILQLLEKDREQRPASAEQVATALSALERRLRQSQLRAKSEVRKPASSDKPGSGVRKAPASKTSTAPAGKQRKLPWLLAGGLLAGTIAVAAAVIAALRGLLGP
jgi:serine/threonine protein kinase